MKKEDERSLWRLGCSLSFPCISPPHTLCLSLSLSLPPRREKSKALNRSCRDALTCYQESNAEKKKGRELSLPLLCTHTVGERREIIMVEL